MKNFPITDPETGKTWWISRAPAVCAIIVGYTPDYQCYLLLQKRGQGVPNFKGAWSHTCGYVDFEENLREALAREVYEETGLDIKNAPSHLIGINDAPAADPLQNITFRFLVEVPLETLQGVINTDSASRGGESGEVEKFMILPIESFQATSVGLRFAWNHKDLTEQVLSMTQYFPAPEVLEFRGESWVGTLFGGLEYQVYTTNLGCPYIRIPDLGLNAPVSDLSENIMAAILVSWRAGTVINKK